MTKDREINDLFQELMDNGIVHGYPLVKLEDYIGDFSYSAFERQELQVSTGSNAPPPGRLDILASILTDCILAMSEKFSFYNPWNLGLVTRFS